MLEKMALVALGIILSAVGYLIKRAIENKPTFESLDKHKKLLDIHRQMNEQGIDLEGLRELEDKLTGKEAAIQSHSAFLQAESSPLMDFSRPESMTQAELNERAAERLKQAQLKMRAAIVGIDSRVVNEVSQALFASQTEWERYSASQAEAAAAAYKSGSIYPLVYLSELESLTNERTARLKAELDELIALES